MLPALFVRSRVTRLTAIGVFVAVPTFRMGQTVVTTPAIQRGKERGRLNSDVMPRKPSSASRKTALWIACPYPSSGKASVVP